MDKKLKLIFSDPLRLVIESNQKSDPTTIPFEKVFVSRVYARFKKSLKQVSCWFGVDEKSHTPVFSADKQHAEGYINSKIIPDNNHVIKSELDNFVVHHFIGDTYLLIGMESKYSRPLFWIRFEPQRTDLIKAFAELHTYIEGLTKLYWIAKLHRVAFIKDITRDLKQSIPALLFNKPQLLAQEHIRQAILEFIQEAGLSWSIYANKTEFFKDRLNNPEVKFKLEYLSGTIDRKTPDFEIGGLIDWVISPMEDEQIKHIIREIQSGGHNKKLDVRQRFLVSFVSSELLCHWASGDDESDFELLEVWGLCVFEHSDMPKKLDRTQLILWFCRQCVITFFNHKRQRQSQSQIIVAKKVDVLKNLQFLANELNRQLYFEVEGLGFKTRPIVVAEKLADLLIFYFEQELNLHIPTKLLNDFRFFLEDKREVDVQDAGAYFQHTIEVLLFGLFMLYDQVNRGKNIRFADSINAQSSTQDVENTQLGDELIVVFVLTAMFHDLGLRQDLLNIEVQTKETMLARIEQLTELGYVDATEAQEMNLYYQHEKHAHAVWAAELIHYQFDTTNKIVPSNYKLAKPLIAKVVRAVLMHPFIQIEPECIHEKDPALALLILCDGIFHWEPSNVRSIAKSKEVVVDNFCFSLAFEQSSAPLINLRWQVDELNPAKYAKYMVVAELNPDIDEVKSVLALVQMMGRLKHIVSWCPRIKINWSCSENDGEYIQHFDFLYKLLSRVKVQEPQLTPYVEDWIISIEKDQSLIGDNYLILQPSVSFFGMVDIYDLFKKYRY